MADAATGTSAISRALERVEFGKTVMRLARRMDGDEDLAEQVCSSLNASKRVDTTTYESYPELMNWLAKVSLRANDDDHVRVEKLLERLAHKSFTLKARMQASDDLFDVASHPQQAQPDDQGCMSKPTFGPSAVGEFPRMKPGAARRGHAVIINVEQFSDTTQLGLVERNGSKCDVDRLKKLAEWLRFKVWCEEDAQGNLLDTVKSIFAKMDYLETDWLMCFLMSHGTSRHIISSDGTFVDLKRVYDAARDRELSRTLANSELPKIFFIQSCRVMTTFDEAVEAIPIDESSSGVHNPLGNFLFSHATRDGEAAYLLGNSGSLYFQKLDMMLRELVPCREHLVDILTKVNEECKKECMDCDGSPVVQTTSTTTELSKHVFLDYTA